MQITSSVARILLVSICLLQIQCTAKVDKQPNSELTPFFGTYTGNSLNVVKGELSERDLAVTIKP